MAVELITVREVQDAVARGGSERIDAQLIDVRESNEVATGMVPGSRHIALGEIATRLDEIDPARPVWAICRSGNRSGQAAEILAANGYRVFNMQGGMLAWNEAGYTVETP